MPQVTASEWLSGSLGPRGQGLNHCALLLTTICPLLWARRFPDETYAGLIWPTPQPRACPQGARPCGWMSEAMSRNIFWSLQDRSAGWRKVLHLVTGGRGLRMGLHSRARHADSLSGHYRQPLTDAHKQDDPELRFRLFTTTDLRNCQND